MGEMRDDDLAMIAGVLNAVPETAQWTERLAPLVRDTNALVRDAADALLTLDASPLSFEALKSRHEPHA
ncbi:MAG: hypothetical protein JWN07_952 [Hyphomicrobiales bacterium]|nr:hypothetical protein [Hyphomicrobiales bacterium]